MVARALLFDLDGTIWDSFPWYASILAGLTQNSKAALLNRLKAGGNIVKLYSDLGVSRNGFCRKAASQAGNLHLFCRVRETLGILKDRGTVLGVVTSLPGYIVDPLINEIGISQFFGTVVSARRGIPPKPNPAGLLAALRNLQINAADDVYYVGDMPADADAARGARIAFAWATYGYGMMPAEDANIKLEQFSDVAEL